MEQFNWSCIIPEYLQTESLVQQTKELVLDNMSNKLELVRLGLDTKDEFIVYIHAGCSIDKSEGFENRWGSTRSQCWNRIFRQNKYIIGYQTNPH